MILDLDILAQRGEILGLVGTDKPIPKRRRILSRGVRR